MLLTKACCQLACIAQELQGPHPALKSSALDRPMPAVKTAYLNGSRTYDFDQRAATGAGAATTPRGYNTAIQQDPCERCGWPC